MQGDAVADVLDAVELLGRGAAHHAVHLIALLEQQLGQVGAVLAGDAGDQRGATVGHAAAAYTEPPTRQSLGRAAAHASPAAPEPRPGASPPAQPPHGRGDPLLDVDPGLPAEQLARLLDRGPAALDVDREGRQVLERERPRDPRRRPPTRCRAISATVSSREAEMLKSSFSPAGELIAVTMPSAMSSTWVSVRVCSPEPKISSGRWPDSTFAIRSGTAWAMPGSASGSSPGP